MKTYRRPVVLPAKNFASFFNPFPAIMAQSPVLKFTFLVSSRPIISDGLGTISCPGFFRSMMSLIEYRFSGVYGSYLSEAILFHLLGASNGPMNDKSSPAVLVIVRACNIPVRHHICSGYVPVFCVKIYQQGLGTRQTWKAGSWLKFVLTPVNMGDLDTMTARYDVTIWIVLCVDWFYNPDVAKINGPGCIGNRL